MTVAAARTAWKAAGFTGAFTPASGKNNLIVDTQDPTKGTCLPPSTTMKVTTSGHG